MKIYGVKGEVLYTTKQQSSAKSMYLKTQCLTYIALVLGKKKGIFKGKKQDERQTVLLKDIFGVSLRRKKTGSSEEEGLCIGE